MDLQSMKILLVDDAKNMRIISRNLLRQIGFANIEEATDGEMALLKLRESKYSLVISDTDLGSGISGIELFKQIRADRQLKSLAFILIVDTEFSKRDFLAAGDTGPSSYIGRPFNADSLKSKIVSVLGEF